MSSLVSVSIAMALAGCGGGGNGSGGTTSPVKMTLAVQPTTITVGQSATLTWSASGANSCVAGGAWSGNQAIGGSEAVIPTAAGTNIYTLTCTAQNTSGYSGGAGGSSPTSATLTVNRATAYVFKNLVSDTANGTTTVDANLVNPWGIAFGTGPVWVANNHTATSTLYDGAGALAPAGNALVVHLAASASGVAFAPTGIVYNGTTDFVVSAGGKSGPGLFIFAGEGGMIAGWSAKVAPTNAVTTYADAGGAVYKGLTLANNGSGNYLYAADFHNNKVDVFDTTFTKQTASAMSFTFKDPALPAGYAPFGIQALKNGMGGAVQIYVAYAQQQAPANHDNVNGAGLGLIDIFDANGKFLKTLVMPGGALNGPWGIALAPADFGTLSNMLLVGNFGDGKINGYDPGTGQFMGAVTDATGAAFAVPGLWGIAFGNDADNQPHNTLFFAAGTNNEVNGSYGRIDLPH
jgi:uncharacterized protein (TIGR03118 family)